MKNTSIFYSKTEKTAYETIVKLLKDSPIPKEQLLHHLSLYLTRPAISQLLFMNDLYKKIINTHGNIFELGTRWGRNLATMISFRNIYEPHNYGRQIIGFDTFSGFPELTKKDLIFHAAKAGDLKTSNNYEKYLHKILTQHESLTPRNHLKRFEIIKGDVTSSLPNYLKEHPETIIALMYFDMDIYKPTANSLKIIKDFIQKGTIIGFDEACLKKWPGETIAIRETLGLSKYHFKRSVYSGYASYLVVE